MGMIDLPAYIVVPEGLELGQWGAALGHNVRVVQLGEFSGVVRTSSREINPPALMSDGHEQCTPRHA